MGGTKLLIDVAINRRSEKARELAVSELCEKNSINSLEYIAKKSKFQNTRRYVTLCLYQMRAVTALKNLLEKGPKDVKEYVDVLLREIEEEFEENEIEVD